MKKLFFTLAAFLLTVCAQAQDISLPAPDKGVKMTLMEALQQRHSSRKFSNKAISDATLSQILWAACGINRPNEKKITAPSAMNRQDIKVYVVRADGAYLFEPETNVLKQVTKKDLRKAIAGRQESVAQAPLFTLLVSDHHKFGGNDERAQRLGAVDVGYVSQNIHLVCTALGLDTVPRMTMDSATLKTELGLDDFQDLLVNHPIGYPAN
jgi:SagB-type dehydrogenase family enzyme